MGRMERVGLTVGSICSGYVSRKGDGLLLLPSSLLHPLVLGEVLRLPLSSLLAFHPKVNK